MNPFFVYVKLFWFFLLLPFLGYAQQPSHYKLGEDELEGVDVYGIHHATDMNYYLATSQGLMIYDGYDFKSLVNQEMRMTSVFNIVEDYKGDIYCHNLSGQVFKLVDDELVLFYTVEKPINSADLSIQIDNQNLLVVCAGKILFIDGAGEVVSDTRIGYTSFPTRISDGTIRLFAKGSNTFYDFKDGRITTDRSLVLKDSTRVLNTIEFRRAELLYETVNGNVYIQSDSTLSEVINMEELTSKMKR